MGIAHRKQSLQDRITQQWVILFGKKIDKTAHEWLLGPFGNTDGIGKKFIAELAEKEQLVVDETDTPKGLLQSFDQLGLSEEEVGKVAPEVINFYENTSNYHLDLKVKWNPFFKVFGVLLKVIFSKRIQQLNIPTQNNKDSCALTSDVIVLKDKTSGEVKRTIWLRTFEASGDVVYSGVYGTCKLPSGRSCVKAVFPLPHGNATVILFPKVGEDGALILESSGKQMGDSGFYFLLDDSKGVLWTKFIRSFKDTLTVSSKDGRVKAIQTMRLWHLNVVRFDYEIRKKGE